MPVLDPVIEAMHRLNERIDLLAKVSDDPHGLTRILFSPAMDKAAGYLLNWMRQAGLEARKDPLMNVVGRWTVADPDAPTFHLGSHYDTVVNAGSYDGILGVLLGLGVVECLREMKFTPRRNLSVLGFCDEEGIRFHSTFLGSSLLCGRFNESWLQAKDAQGMTMQAWLESRGESVTALLEQTPVIRPQDQFIEAHIEQGPVLEFLKLPLGVFTQIAAQMRIEVMVLGKSEHAGTTPGRMRKDALAGAACMISEVESLCRRADEIRATVGKIYCSPNASNVIADTVKFTIDLRHAQAETMWKLYDDLLLRLKAIADQRGLILQSSVVQHTKDISCDPQMTQRLKSACLTNQSSSPELLSGAGHDTIMVSQVCPAAMLAVRCREGVSHHPDEYASPADIEVALRALVDTVIKMDE